ncbi:MAG TPA: YMGG-like glycine zipper-containing protein [Gemmatimonadaceae bacterium]
MRTSRLMILVPMAALLAACGRNSTPQVDDALKADLALASQAQPLNAQANISATEAGLGAQSLTSVARQPVAAASVRRTSTARRTSASRSSGSSGGASTGAYYPPAPPPVHVEKHTQRDAAIGAAAGAVLGATTSRNKVRGGIIGAAVGGILGGVIGNNVDVQKKIGW